jgi:predicted permease
MIWTILAAFLPVFAVIAIGYGVRASNYLPRGLWRGVNAVNHRILLPAFLIAVLAGADLSHPAAGQLATISAIGSVLLLTLAVSAAFLLRLNTASAPVIATAVQWNFVLTLALVSNLAGPEAAPLVAAVVAPGVLIGAIITVGSFALVQGARPAAAAVRIVRDPMVIAALVGLLANATGLLRAPFLTDTIELIGAGALPVILLSMGAGLDFAALKGRIRPLATAAILRCVAGPVVFVGLAVLFNLSGPAAVALAIAGAAPSAAFIYAIAADFEADTGLTAGMITLTVLCSAAVSPLAAFLALSL